MIRILHTELSRDALELLSSRITRDEVTLHVIEQRRHQTEYVVGRREVEDLGLCRVEVALRAFEQRAIAQYPEALLPLQFRRLQTR